MILIVFIAGLFTTLCAIHHPKSCTYMKSLNPQNNTKRQFYHPRFTHRELGTWLRTHSTRQSYNEAELRFMQLSFVSSVWALSCPIGKIASHMIDNSVDWFIVCVLLQERKLHEGRDLSFCSLPYPRSPNIPNSQESLSIWWWMILVIVYRIALWNMRGFTDTPC